MFHYNSCKWIYLLLGICYLCFCLFKTGLRKKTHFITGLHRAGDDYFTMLNVQSLVAVSLVQSIIGLVSSLFFICTCIVLASLLTRYHYWTLVFYLHVIFFARQIILDQTSDIDI